MCDGVPCVRSLWVEPPYIAPCVPEPALPPEGQALPPPVRTKVIEYPSADIGACNGLSVCILNTPPGYRLCLVGHGLQVDHPCPDAWPERHTGWEIAEEARFCSACSCGPMQGASCKALAKAYSDATCGQELASMTVTSTLTDACVNLPLGAALGGKTAEVVSYEPGICTPSGGELIGEPLTEWPVTYCCRPEIASPP